MVKLAETFKNRLASALEPRGIAAAARGADLSRKTVDRWLRGENVPDLNQVDDVAGALGRPAIDLLFPGELPKPVVMKPNPEQAIEAIREALAGGLTGVRRELFEEISALDEAEAAAALDGLRMKREALKGREKAKPHKGRG